MARKKEAIELYLEIEKDISFKERFLGIQKFLFDLHTCSVHYLLIDFPLCIPCL